MKKLSLISLALLCATSLFAIEKSQTMVVINGAKYYIHTVRTGETLYALSKTYGVGERVIIEYNPSAESGLKVDERIKIPFTADVADIPSERKLRKDFDMHFVAKGETLYGISRRYSIPIPRIIEDNPNLDPIHLREGERILIRRTDRGTEAASKVEAQWVEYKDNLNRAAEGGTAYHMVHAGDTFYSISHRYNISEQALSAMNNGLQATDLKAGAIIKVPGTIPTSHDGGTAATEQASAGSVNTEQPACPQEKRHFKALDRSATLRVALMLPISVDGKANANYLEFYQGFLQGLDSIKREGYSVQLDLYNTGRNTDKVRQQIQQGRFKDVDLIVGPVYEETLAPVVELAEKQGIPVVSPLANLTQVRSDVLFQLSPADNNKYEKIANLTDGSRKVTLIYTDRTDKEFEGEVLKALGTTLYEKRNFRYNSAARGQSGGSADLSPILQNDNENLFVIMSDNEVDVDRVLAALSSANTNIVARGYTAPKFVVLGNTRWNRFNNIDRTMLFKNRIIFLSTYHAKRDSELIRKFDSDYIRAFGSLPTLYSYRGYDSAIIFCRGMFGDIEQNMELEAYTPLQTSYHFEQKGDDGIHINNNWMRVNYNNDFTITIE